MAGVTKGCEVVPGPVEEAVDEGGPVLHPYPASTADYLPVRNMARTSYPCVAYSHDARAEGDVVFDLEPAAAAQRRRPGRKPLHEVGQQFVKVLVQGDDGARALEARPHMSVTGELVGVRAHDQQVIGCLYRGEPRPGDVDGPGAGNRADRRAHRRLELDHRGARRVARVDGLVVDDQWQGWPGRRPAVP